jgi:hypothetical protein
LPKFKIILALLIIALAASLSWQIWIAINANNELLSDMQALATQVSARAGLTAPSSDEDLRRDILVRAQRHGIDLSPNQITVQRAGGLKLEEQEIYLAVDYSRPLHLLGVTFALHFTPEARHQFNAGEWSGSPIR